MLSVITKSYVPADDTVYVVVPESVEASPNEGCTLPPLTVKVYGAEPPVVFKVISTLEIFEHPKLLLTSVEASKAEAPAPIVKGFPLVSTVCLGALIPFKGSPLHCCVSTCTVYVPNPTAEKV